MISAENLILCLQLFYYMV